MKQQCIPKFLKEEISKYVCVIIKNKGISLWCYVTPYMSKIITLYDNIPAQDIIASYTGMGERFGYVPITRQRFAIRWFRNNATHFYNDVNAKIYIDKYCPEGME